MTDNRQNRMTRYQGKNLVYLLMSICVPAGLLFLRLMFGVAATSSSATPLQALWLNRTANAAWVLFLIAQLAGAYYMKRMLPEKKSQLIQALQYAGVLVMGLCFSVCGAVLLEGFGYNLWLRVKH